jgi:Bacterial membrane protein YfhO
MDSTQNIVEEVTAVANARSARAAQQRVSTHPDLIRLLAVAGAVLVLLAPWLLNPDLSIVSPTGLGTDFITKQWPNATYIVQEWQQEGEMPLWRTAALGGVPIIGNPSMLLVYPVYWLIFLFPVSWALTLYFALHLMWAGWGVYGLARRTLELSPDAALLAALIFALSAKLVAHLGGGHADVVAAVAWLPWLWWAADELAQRPGWLPVVRVAIATAAQALTHLPTLWLSAWVTGFWWLSVRLADHRPGVLRWWLRSMSAGLIAIVLAVMLSAAQIWPMLELLPFSTRGSVTLSEASQYALPVPLLIGLVFPIALAFPEWVIYPGFVMLALAPASWLTHRLRGWRFLIVLVVLGIVFSLGNATWLYPMLFRILPGMNWLRVPTRMMFLVQLALALLAGAGWDGLARTKLHRTSALAAWWAILALLVVIGMVWTRWFPGAVAVSTGSALVAIVIAAVLLASLHSQIIRLYAPLALIALVIGEALALAPRLIAGERVSALTMPTPLIRFLAAQPGHLRVYSPRGLVTLAQAVTHGLETADGNDPFQFSHYVRWVNAATGCDLETYSVSVPTCAGNEVDPQAYLRTQPDSKLLGAGNVRYVVTDHALSQWSSLVWQSDSVRVYENPDALPWAFVVSAALVEIDDATALAELQSRGPTKVATVTREPEYALSPDAAYHAARVIHRASNRIEVQADGPGWLVLSETWAPGWRASMDGAQAQVYRTDVAFRGLPLPEGSHTVTLTYAPTGWLWGRWASLVGIMATVATIAAALWNRQRGDRCDNTS